MLDFVLCDDNLNFLNNLENTLNKLFMKNDFNAQVSFKTTNVEELLDYIKSNKSDVIFLDINLKSNINGLDVAEKIRKVNKNMYLIFTTAHLEYAFLAFQVKSFDYLPKPVTPDRLENTLIRLFDDIAYSSNGFIPINNKIYIKEDDIYYIKRDGMKLVFETTSNSYETYSSFNKLSSKLPHNFIRCHKSYIANINNIKCIEVHRGTIIFNNNIECYIGPKYKADFLEVINSDKFKCGIKLS